MTYTPALFPPAPTHDVPGPRLEHLDRSWIFRLPRELRSLNRTMWAHWRHAQRERQQWELELAGAVAAFEALHPAHIVELRPLLNQRERRRVRVIRLVPHARHFLDPGNLRACDKHLVDAMKRVGLIHNDNATWLEHTEPTEAIAPDGEWWTVVQLSRPDARAAWRF